MTACWFRLTQPENSSRKKASGGGTGAMAGVCLTGDLRSTGATLGILRRHAGLRFLRRRRPPSASRGQFPGDPHAARVFAQDAVGAPHMWHAAKERKTCQLTVLGEHYRRLVEDGLI
jgi:hypothetical protein